MRGGKYTKTLAKIWVKGITRIRDIRGNVLPKVITEFCYKSVNLHLEEFINIKVILFLTL